MREIFKDIKGYEGKYQVSNFGNVKTLERKSWNNLCNVYSVYKEKIKNKTKQKNGYLTVILYDDKNMMKCLTIHRLVAESFIDNPKNKSTVNHIDGNKANNNINNLEWNTHTENVRHANINGFGKSILTPNDIKLIREYLSIGLKQKHIAYKFNVKKCIIADISANRTWKYI